MHGSDPTISHAPGFHGFGPRGETVLVLGSFSDL